MCGANDKGYSTGIYDAELQAILRALIAVPLSWPITIYSDNKSAVTAISRPSNNATQRSLMRRGGRPWLAMIDNVIGRKHATGAHVDIRHVHAHTRSSAKESVGNRCADLLAKRATIKDTKCSYLPIENGDGHVTIREEKSVDHKGKARVVTQDIRKSARECMTRRMQQQWTRSNTQSAYSGYTVGVRELWKWSITYNSIHTAWILKAITNILHWRTCGVARACPHHEEKDNEAASIKHITVCEAYIEQRREMADQLIQLVECNSSDAEYGQRFPAKWRKMINKEKHKDVRHILYDWGIFQEGDGVPNSEMESTMFGAFCSANVHRAMTGSGAPKQQVEDMVRKMRVLVHGMVFGMTYVQWIPLTNIHR